MTCFLPTLGVASRRDFVVDEPYVHIRSAMITSPSATFPRRPAQTTLTISTLPIPSD
jgi:hypothetical protein